jgi:hypothetical protein
VAWEPDYTTREGLKNYLTSGTAGVADTVDNDWLDLAVTAASRAVDRECSKHVPRQFGQVAVAEARYYTARFDSTSARWVVEIDDIMVSTGMAVTLDINQDDVHETAISTYVLRPRSAAAKSRPWTQIALPRGGSQPSDWPDAVKVVGTWGWSAVPSTIVQATLLQASRFFTRKQAPFGTRGTPDDGSEEMLQYNADPDVKLMLRSYVKSVETL